MTRAQKQPPKLSPAQHDTLLAVRDAEPSPTGAIKLANVRTVLSRPVVRDWLRGDRDDRALNAALQSLRRAGLIESLGLRDPKTGEKRAHWGWRLTRAGRKAAAL